MTPFQRQFTSQLLDELKTILSNPGKLNDANQAYTKGNKDIRYQTNTDITKCSQWSANQIELFNSALFQALERTSTSLSSRNPYTPYANEELIKEINNATNQFRARVIPKITEHVDTANPLASVVNNITNIKSEYAATSPYTFFSIAAAGIIIAAGVAAAQLKN